MLADAHKQAALDLEHLIADAGDPTLKPYIGRGVIDLYWGAAFQWIAYGCQQKHGKHKENHTHLVSYLRDIGEPQIGTQWESMEHVRAGGFYGHHNMPEDVEEARQYWQEIRTWALS